MLVLSRKRGQEVLIPQYGIVITILEASGGKARLGFTAPVEVKIMRRELHDQLTPSSANGHGTKMTTQAS
jgi:carbon storage regulator CsrA